MFLPRIRIGLAREERLPAVLLLVLFAALCVAGGASREDVMAQSVIRGVAFAVMIVQIAVGGIPDIRRYKACAIMLASMMAVAIIQLVPLPPTLWSELPGRAVIASSPEGATGWRPMNFAPDAGWNAFFSLVVPLAVIVLLSSLENRTVRRVQYLLAGAVGFSALFALLQAAGSAPDNPLINGSTIDYGGIFANRNHQALFLSIGVLVLWFLGFRDGGDWRNKRLWLAGCFILLFSISILVTGSRTGAVLGILAIVTGPIVARPPQREERRSYAFWIWPTVSIAIVGGVLLLSAYFGRAASFDRAAAASLDNEFRLRALPTLWEVAKTYFPFGAGLGTFDNVFRIAEPFTLLEPTYFNHAHNDFLEMVIETGAIGPIIFLGSTIWAAGRSVKAFRQQGERARAARLGALIFVWVIVAGLSDYPARTPIIMATLMIAGCWLTAAGSHTRGEEVS